jgi:hypothetical protein
VTERRKAALVPEEELERLRAELRRLDEATGLPRWNADPDDVQRSVVRLVLSLVEFLRQALKRMEGSSLTPEEVESMGQALMKLEETVHDLAQRFGLRPEELNLDLGPLGRLV